MAVPITDSMLRCINNVLLSEEQRMLQLRLQPDEAIYMKIVVKKPGLEMESIVSELDLSYKQRYGDTYIPDAYERLILDAIRGDQQHFVRRCGLLLHAELSVKTLFCLSSQHLEQPHKCTHTIVLKTAQRSWCAVVPQNSRLPAVGTTCCQR